MEDKTTTLAEAVRQLVPDGCSLGIAAPAVTPIALVSMAGVREIARQRKRDLTVFAAMAELETDLLIGADCVSAVQCWAAQLFGRGTPPNFRRAAQDGTLVVREHSEFTFTLGALAGSMGVEFIPLHGYHTDNVRHHPEWPLFPSPYDGTDLLAIAAIAPDVALIHVPRADRYGNAQFGETLTGNVAAQSLAPQMVRAAKRVILTTEEIIPTERIRAAPHETKILYHDVDAVVHVPHGAHPHGVSGYYQPDTDHISAYAEAARTVGSFQDYLARYIHSPADHDAYRQLIRGE